MMTAVVIAPTQPPAVCEPVAPPPVNTPASNMPAPTATEGPATQESPVQVVPAPLVTKSQSEASVAFVAVLTPMKETPPVSTGEPYPAATVASQTEASPEPAATVWNPPPPAVLGPASNAVQPPPAPDFIPPAAAQAGGDPQPCAIWSAQRQPTQQQPIQQQPIQQQPTQQQAIQPPIQQQQPMQQQPAELLATPPQPLQQQASPQPANQQQHTLPQAFQQEPDQQRPTQQPPNQQEPDQQQSTPQQVSQSQLAPQESDTPETPARPISISPETKTKPAGYLDGNALQSPADAASGAMHDQVFSLASFAAADPARAGGPAQSSEPGPAATPYNATAEALRTTESNLAAPPPRTAPAQEIAIRIAPPDSPAVDLRVVERSGQVHVDVRTPDAAMQASLRQDLGALANSLERAGYHTETFTPSSTPGRTVSSAQPGNQDSQQDPSPNRGGTGDFSGGRRQQQPQKRPWLEEFEEQP